MNCPNHNVLRAYLDCNSDPLNSSALKEHLLSCSNCQERCQAFSSVAAFVSSQLGSLAFSPAESNPQMAFARFKAPIFPIPRNARLSLRACFRRVGGWQPVPSPWSSPSSQFLWLFRLHEVLRNAFSPHFAWNAYKPSIWTLGLSKKACPASRSMLLPNCFPKMLW